MGPSGVRTRLSMAKEKERTKSPKRKLLKDNTTLNSSSDSKEVLLETSMVEVAPARKTDDGVVKVPPKRVGTKKKKGRLNLNKCPHCGLVLSSHSKLRIHLDTHADGRPFSCRFCFWRFKREVALFRHLKCTHFKSEEVAFKLAYGVLENTQYNMRDRNKLPPPPVRVPSPVPKRRKLVIMPRQEPLVVKREVIVIVGDMKFCTPGLMLEPPKRTIQGCATWNEWFWEDYHKALDDLIHFAPLTKTEPEYELSLVEMANLCLGEDGD
ncbi:unnamed protein product [Orchesella dallaii]|uniref:C2H2-type domain-containing protein n=1 Tax=Orchesella dallaii TaxID=48710 RepID=A0ABP1PMW3_9HEXA